MKKLTILIAMLMAIGGCASPQAIVSIYEAQSDFHICFAYFQPKIFGAARSQEWRYNYYKRVVNEIDKRNLDCRKFPDFDNRTDYFRDRIEKFEKDGAW